MQLLSGGQSPDASEVCLWILIPSPSKSVSLVCGSVFEPFPELPFRTMSAGSGSIQTPYHSPYRPPSYGNPSSYGNTPSYDERSPLLASDRKVESPLEGTASGGYLEKGYSENGEEKKDMEKSDQHKNKDFQLIHVPESTVSMNMFANEIHRKPVKVLCD